MTTPSGVPRLDYATPGERPRANWLLRVLVGVAAAFLGADACALAAGFDPVVEAGRDPAPVFARIFAALLILLLVLAAAGPVGRLAAGWADALSGGGGGGALARPAAVTLLVCGTVCVVAALTAEVCLVRHGRTTVTVAASDYGRSPGRVVTVVRPPVFGRVLAASALVAGVAMVGAGVWGGRGGRPPG